MTMWKTVLRKSDSFIVGDCFVSHHPGRPDKVFRPTFTCRGRVHCFPSLPLVSPRQQVPPNHQWFKRGWLRKLPFRRTHLGVAGYNLLIRDGAFLTTWRHRQAACIALAIDPQWM